MERTLVPHSAASGRETGLGSLLLQLVVKAELLRKVTMEEVKGTQRDPLVQLWSNRSGPALQVGVHRHRYLNESAVASPNEASIGCDPTWEKKSQAPQWGTGAPIAPHARTQLNSPSASEHRRLREVDR
jgi:hypothetical protein